LEGLAKQLSSGGVQCNGDPDMSRSISDYTQCDYPLVAQARFRAADSPGVIELSWRLHSCGFEFAVPDSTSLAARNDALLLCAAKLD
jgi:hypothetical protein